MQTKKKEIRDEGNKIEKKEKRKVKGKKKKKKKNAMREETRDPLSMVGETKNDAWVIKALRKLGHIRYYLDICIYTNFIPDSSMESRSISHSMRS